MTIEKKRSATIVTGRKRNICLALGYAAKWALNDDSSLVAVRNAYTSALYDVNWHLWQLN